MKTSPWDHWNETKEVERFMASPGTTLQVTYLISSMVPAFLSSRSELTTGLSIQLVMDTD